MTAARAIASVVAAALVAHAGSADAAQRLIRIFDRDDGLEVASINAIAEDHHGYLWLGSETGLTRFDGRTFERWATDSIDELVHQVATGAGRVIVVVRAKEVWEVRGRDVVPVVGPDGAQLAGVHQMAVAGDGALWVIAGGALWHASPAGRWSEPIELPGDRPYGLDVAENGHAIVGGRRALWRVTLGGEVERLAELPERAINVTVFEDGSVGVTASYSGKAFVYQGGALELIAERDATVYNIVRRRGALWISWDGILGSVRPGEPLRAFEAPDTGKILIDRESSLWAIGPRGLIQYVEPETAVWGVAEGMKLAHTRAVARGPEGVFVTGWNEPTQVLDEATGVLRPIVPDIYTVSGPRLCRDGDGAIWGHGRRGIAAWRDGAVEQYPLEGVGVADRCSVAPDGRVWFATDAGLVLAGGEGAPRPVEPLPADRIGAAYEDARGTLWIGFAETVCAGSAAAARTGRDPGWACDEIPGSVHPNDFLETERGTLWLGTRQAGLQYYTGDGWAPVPAANDLPGKDIRALTHSPRGGVWIGTPAGVVRVREGAGPTAPWTVLEELGTWNGLERPAASDVLEDPDGTVWLATSLGLARVAASARAAERPAPAVSLAGVRANGEPRDPGDAVELPYGDHHLELSFTAAAFRDRSLLRFRMRLGPDGAWSAPTREPVFNLVNLRPGRYEVEVAASLDGRTWSPAPARFDLAVARPWWMRPHLWIIAGLLLAAGLYAAYRVRLAFALRLERQRARIAADLHDEMGSGLGSIGLLAGVAAESERGDGEVAEQIAETAAELGDALTDIVWSLRATTDSARELAAHLTRRGESLLSPGGTTFTTSLPTEWPRVELSLPVRRNVQLIATEALHNAARHARAANVELGIAPDRKRWLLWIEDDGVGMGGATESRPFGGLGLENMRARAAQIGADLEISPGQGGRGTRVALRFDPRADDRRLP